MHAVKVQRGPHRDMHQFIFEKALQQMRIATLCFALAEIYGTMSSLLQMGKLRLKEGKRCARVHTARDGGDGDPAPL